MNENLPPPAAPHEAAPAPLPDSLAVRLNFLITSPVQLMARVAAAPRWWLPGLIVFLLTAGNAWLTSPISGPESLEVMRDSKLMRVMPEEQWQEQYEQALDPDPASRMVSAVTAGFVAWVLMLLFGVVLAFMARLGGGRGTVSQALGVVAWGSLIPMGLGTLIRTPLVLITESAFRVSFGLALLVPAEQQGTGLHQALMGCGDFFAWWGLAVLVIGFQHVYKMSRGAAAAAVILPWLLFWAVVVGLALIFM